MAHVQFDKLDFGQKVLAAPMLPLMEGLCASVCTAMNKVLLVTIMAQQAPGFDEEELGRQLEGYGKREMKKALGLLGSLVPD
jgi:hypothetical protein